MKRKTLQELTIKDNFMFAAVMLDSDNCKGVLERALDMKIDRVEVQYEKSIVYHPEYKGIRLDVYAKDENNRHFNVEIILMEIGRFSSVQWGQMKTKCQKSWLISCIM